jgi:uncharacterized membrane protein
VKFHEHYAKTFFYLITFKIENGNMTLIFAIIFLVVGFFLRFQINKRRFNRRNMAGVEEFKSYGSAYTTQIIEKFGRYAGLLLIIVGILMLFSFFFRSSTEAHRTNDKVNQHKVQ